MADGVNTDYCSFTKAVEYLGDRWCLLILRELATQGPLGFNALATSIPGHISRSILNERLRRLRDLGIITRPSGKSQAPYALTDVGTGLIPMMMALNSWAGGWLPEDPAFVARDPEIVLGWLAERVVTADLPESQVVVELRMRDREEHRSWLVLEAGAEPHACLEDPLLDESRYVYVEVGSPVLMALARGRREWADALAEGSVQTHGDPRLIQRLPSWFKRADVPVVPAAPTASPLASSVA